MNRKISDKHVTIIKNMLVKKYKTSAICQILQIDYNENIISSDINSIKRCESYSDISAELNDKLLELYPVNGNYDEDLISVIKSFLAEGFSSNDILANYPSIKNKQLMQIKMGINYLQVAPQYNETISNMYGRKKNTNIDCDLVTRIKRQYIRSNGKITYTDIAQTHNIDKASVSNIINLNWYPMFGLNLNDKILQIKKRKSLSKEREKEKENKIKLKRLNAKVKKIELMKKSLDKDLQRLIVMSKYFH